MSFDEERALELARQSSEDRDRDHGPSSALAEQEENNAEGEYETEEAAEGEEKGLGEERTHAKYNSIEVNDKCFDDLILEPDVADEIRASWNIFLHTAESREAAGEAIYSAIFDAAPSLQNLFKTPRAVMSMRFVSAFTTLINCLDDPKALRTTTETMGFQHLEFETSIPRVMVFRDAIVDQFQVELEGRFSKKAREGWSTLLNYLGGAFIFVRLKFQDRLKILQSSWATANNSASSDFVEAAETAAAEAANAAAGEEEHPNAMEEEKKKGGLFGKAKTQKVEKADSFGGKLEAGADIMRNTSVPTTFNEMFLFNAAVMGFEGHNWMREVLASFDTIVTNMNNSNRFQEECDVLSLRIAKYKGSINLGEYKAVMLASLRSLVPKDWNSDHEVAWSWLWENVERMIKGVMGKPAQQELALEKLWGSLDESSQKYMRREVYTNFFALAPTGQEYFKQSTTRLHFIADKVAGLTMDMFKDPKRIVEDLSAIGLRHVTYDVPTDLFGPFVTACVGVVRTLTDDDLAVQAYTWSLSLISRILTRVINEGSTIVVKAVNMNSSKQLKKAVGCAPRGKRAMWLLNIQVGTQSISPFLWAIESGSLDAAKAIITDLLTIRADRDRYYYGMDMLFDRHPDIIRRLYIDAPGLIPGLLDGLIWRNRLTESGQRRVNYYIKHLMLDPDRNFAKNIEWITQQNDPTIVCHPVVSLTTDLVWSRLALRTFLGSKLWFIFTLLVFVCSQSILKRLRGSGTVTESPFELRFAIFLCRLFIYMCSMGQWVFFHAKHFGEDLRNRNIVRWMGRIPMPAYLVTSWQDMSSFLLTVLLLLMVLLEPILHCLGTDDINAFSGEKMEIFTQKCNVGVDILDSYSIISALAMLCYFLLLIDLAVFSTRLSAFVLVCGRVLSEVALFIFGLTFFACGFASAVCSLAQDDQNFSSIPQSGLALFKITFGMFGGANFENLTSNTALFTTVTVYVITTLVFLLNLLIAQLNCAYQSTYEDMLGYARLNRGKILVETMPSVPHKRWEKFVANLGLDDPVEFGEGDMGVSGGIQLLEPANANVTIFDMIKRFGGSTSPAAQWPEDVDNDEDDRFDRVERLIEKAMKRMTTGAKNRGSNKQSSGGGSSQENEDMSGSVSDATDD